jgi:hypothetical protein
MEYAVDKSGVLPGVLNCENTPDPSPMVSIMEEALGSVLNGHFTVRGVPNDPQVME